MTPFDWLPVVSTAATQPFGCQLKHIPVVGPVNSAIYSGLKTDNWQPITRLLDYRNKFQLRSNRRYRDFLRDWVAGLRQ